MDEFTEWNKQRLERIKAEALRVIERIDALTEHDIRFGGRKMAAVKRATLDFNQEAVKLRKGWYQREE